MQDQSGEPRTNIYYLQWHLSTRNIMEQNSYVQVALSNDTSLKGM